jgi:hypothetical protein
MSFAFSQMTCDKLHEPLKDGTTYTCPFCYATKARAEYEELYRAAWALLDAIRDGWRYDERKETLHSILLRKAIEREGRT